MSAESDYRCEKCGYEWCAIPPTECPKCNPQPLERMKEETKWTKGKWRLSYDAQGPNMIMHPTKKGVALAVLTETFKPLNGIHEGRPTKKPVKTKPFKIGNPEEVCDETYWPEKNANVYLMAAAQDLYDALKRVEKGSEWLTDEDFKVIRAALSRAEGK